jgi:hypothetical protein
MAGYRAEGLSAGREALLWRSTPLPNEVARIDLAPVNL